MCGGVFGRGLPPLPNAFIFFKRCPSDGCRSRWHGRVAGGYRNGVAEAATEEVAYPSRVKCTRAGPGPTCHVPPLVFCLAMPCVWHRSFVVCCFFLRPFRPLLPRSVENEAVRVTCLVPRYVPLNFTFSTHWGVSAFRPILFLKNRLQTTRLVLCVLIK